MHNFACKVKHDLQRGCLSLDLSRLDNQKVEFVLKMLPLFKRFEITASSLIPFPKIIAAIEASTSLRNIQFTNCTITSKDSETIGAIYARNCGLRSITLTECIFAEASNSSLQNIVSTNSVRALFLERCKISSAPLFNFHLGLTQTTSLRRIALDFAMELATLATILLTNRGIKFFRASEFTGSEDDITAVKDAVIENDVILLVRPIITEEINRLMLYNRDSTCRSLQM